MGGRVPVMRPIYTYPVNINYFSKIKRGRVASILRPTSTSTIVTTSITSIINSTITRGRMSGIKITISNSSINNRHYNNLIIINTIVIKIVGGGISGLLRNISKTSITTNIKTVCLSVVVDCILVDYLLIGLILLSWCYQWCWGMNCVRRKGSIASGTRDQWYRELDCVGGEGINCVGDEVSMDTQ